LTRSLPDVQGAVLLGQRAPRIRHVPPAAATAGPEALDLLRTTGQEPDPWQCDAVCDILAENEHGRWAARRTYGIAPRQNGKGGIIEPIQLYGVFVLHEVILHSAHLFDTARDAFQRVLALIEGTPDLSRRLARVNRAHGKEGIELLPRPAVFGGDGMLYDRGGPGGKLHFHARTNDSGRGKSPQRLILDEAFALTPAQQAALMFAISAQDDPQINAFSTPPPVDEPCELLIAARAQVLAAIDAGDVPRVAWLEWGVERGADVTKPETWAAANPAYGIRITEDGCMDELSAAIGGGGIERFAVERCGMWPDMAEAKWQVIGAEEWSTAADPTKARAEGARPAFCLEMSPDRSWAAIGAAWLRPDGLRQVEVIDIREGIGWIPARIEALRAHEPVAWVVARDSPASSEVSTLERAGVDVIRMSGPEAVAGSGMFHDGIAGRLTADDGVPTPRTLRHSDQDQVTAAVAAAAQYPPNGKAWQFDRAKPGGWLLICCVGALWGLATQVPEQPQQFFAAWK
jgi:hypothetical protein